MNDIKLSKELRTRLNFAQNLTGEKFLPTSFDEHLRRIKKLSNLIEIEREEKHPLWWFLPAIIYDVFPETTAHEWLVQKDTSKQSVVLIPPSFIPIVENLESELLDLGLQVSKSSRSFSNILIALLYGGFPWFESYHRIISKRNLIGKKCVILNINSINCDVPAVLESFKRKKRMSFGKPLQEAFEDLHYPGLVRPFHIPAKIETIRHMKAIRECN